MSASPHVLTPSPASSDHGHSSSSPQPSPSNAPLSALSQLSRATSVISSSSSSSSLSLHQASPSPPHDPSPPQHARLHPPPSPRPTQGQTRRNPGMHLQLGGTSWSGPRSPHATPPATPRGERSPLFGVPREMLPDQHDADERWGQRHMSIASAASADTARTIRPQSRGPPPAASSSSHDHRQQQAGTQPGQPPHPPSPRDFKYGRELGTGSYSVVTAAYLPSNGQTYAIKALDKAHVLRWKQQGGKVDVQNERKALMKLSRPGHPGVVRLFWAMQDATTLYFVLDLCPKGDMTTLLRRLGSFSLPCARFYFAQITDAVQFIHSQGIIHRDLKPDNFLFTDAWRIKITDFGSAKIVEPEDSQPGGAEAARRSSFVGSPQYVSPEILSHQPVSFPTDLWSLGIILYQLIAGHFPFDSGPSGGMAHYLMWQRVLKGEYTFSPGWDADAQDLVSKLLVNDPSQRLGAKGGEAGAQELRSHQFFHGLDWASLWTCEPPPFEPGMFRRSPRSTARTEGGGYVDEELESDDEWEKMLERVARVSSGDEMEEAVDEDSASEEFVPPAARARPTVSTTVFPREHEPIQESGKSSRSSSSSASASHFSQSQMSTTSRRTSTATAATSVSPQQHVPSHPALVEERLSAGKGEEPQPEEAERTILSGPVYTRSLLGSWTKERTLTLTDRRLLLTKGGKGDPSGADNKPRLELPLASQSQRQQSQGEDTLTAETKGPRMLVLHKGGKKWEFMLPSSSSISSSSSPHSASPSSGPSTPTRSGRASSLSSSRNSSRSPAASRSRAGAAGAGGPPVTGGGQEEAQGLTADRWAREIGAAVALATSRQRVGPWPGTESAGGTPRVRVHTPSGSGSGPGTPSSSISRSRSGSIRGSVRETRGNGGSGSQGSGGSGSVGSSRRSSRSRLAGAAGAQP